MIRWPVTGLLTNSIISAFVGVLRELGYFSGDLRYSHFSMLNKDFTLDGNSQSELRKAKVRKWCIRGGR